MAERYMIDAYIVVCIYAGDINKIKKEFDKKMYSDLNINGCLEISASMGRLELVKYFKSLGATNLAEAINPAILSDRGDVVLYLLEELNTTDTMPQNEDLIEHTIHLIKLIESYNYIPKFVNCLATLIEKHPNPELNNISENIVIKLLETGFDFEKIPNYNKYEKIRNIINERRLYVKQRLSPYLLDDIIQIINSLHQI
jgi:hypothetical protein